jgi:hypothetical protein
MFKIPKIANVIPVNASFTTLSVLPTFYESIDESLDFQFNITKFISEPCKFSYYVGEGPLYWYRIDWYDSNCIQTCDDITPTISYIEPNCPYEIIEHCIIMDPICPCDPPCTPGECVEQNVEVWHMLATSVTHLCERINQECCHRKPPGFMRRVQQYGRPALCCDVEAHGPGSDNYSDVNFFLCECGNLVDPCLKKIIYPCHINRCGIHGTAFEGEDPEPTPVGNYQFTSDLLGHQPEQLGMFQEIELEPPTAKEPAHRFGSTIPDIIHCHHNLNECNLFKDFLKRAKTTFSDIDLYYNNEYKSWQGTKGFKEWKFIFEWKPNQHEEAGSAYNFNIFVENKNLKSKLFLIVKLTSFLNDKNIFEIDLNFNTKTSKLSKFTLQSKILHDDIGIFKNSWANELKVNMRG